MLKILWLGALFIAAIAVFFVDQPEGQCADPEPTIKQRPFADFGFMPPAESYSGRVFRLSQDYPTDKPEDAERPEFMKIDFRKEWRSYMIGVRDYCLNGNIDSGDVEDAFQVATTARVRWFHMPWQHYGPFGREGIHGLTKEAPVNPRQLGWTQESAGQTYAIGFFNRFGGYAIGRIWKDHEKPELHGIAFPNGTVVFKLLFVDIPPAEVPSQSNPVVWQAYATDTFASTHRSVVNLSLIQMDIMVRDPQSPSGWVFGTFQYNGLLKKKIAWENLVPVGIQWGNDEDNREHRFNPQPVATVRNPALKETIINEDDKELPVTHLGWNGRLNGPVDNPMSSCMSCHATAQVRAKSPNSPLFQDRPPAPGSDEWMRWFKNYKCEERFDPEVPAADFSLQLAISIQNYLKWRSEAIGISATNYAYQSKKAELKTEGISRFKERISRNGKEVEVPKVQRNFDP